MDAAGEQAWFLHCLPAHRGEEVAASVIDGPRSVVWQQAANRMHAARAVLTHLLDARNRQSDGDAVEAWPDGRDAATESTSLMATLGKPQRQHRIARLLEEQAISSQAQLVEMLAADGVIATQATVSRDLEELGAVKVRIPGGAMAYAIPEHAKERHRARRPPAAGDGRVRGGGRAQRRTWWCCARRPVPRTSSPPRSTAPASPDVLGTVAGDDTIILVCARRPAVARWPPTSPPWRDCEKEAPRSSRASDRGPGNPARSERGNEKV